MSRSEFREMPGPDPITTPEPAGPEITVRSPEVGSTRSTDTLLSELPTTAADNRSPGASSTALAVSVASAINIDVSTNDPSLMALPPSSAPSTPTDAQDSHARSRRGREIGDRVASDGTSLFRARERGPALDEIHGGVVVVGVSRSGSATGRIKPGDVILEIDDLPVLEHNVVDLGRGLLVESNKRAAGDGQRGPDEVLV